MTIYTTGEVDAQALALLLKERDELRAALKERDEEIEENEQMRDRMSKLLTGTANALKGEPIHDWSDLPKVATAQRKVLEQALEALHDATWYVEQEDRVMGEYHFQHPWRRACKAAIREIKEILN